MTAPARRLVAVVFAAVVASVTVLSAQLPPVVRALTEPWPTTDKVDGIEILPVLKHVYMLVGAGANVTVQNGDQGVTLVDAGSTGTSDAVMAAVRHLTSKPIRYLVDTGPDIDNGMQTRLLHFDPTAAPSSTPEWQGFSLAKWETVVEGQGQAPFAGGQAGGQNALAGHLSGSARIITTHMRPGYLRRNGVPYSANAVLTEFLDRTSEPNGDSWLVLTQIIDDPQYLQIPVMLTTHYKREADGSKFTPRPCEVTPPVSTAR